VRRQAWSAVSNSKKEIIMKTGIFIALAALALAVFAVPEAQGKSGRTLDLQFSGSNFTTSSVDGRPAPLGVVSTSLQSGILTGSGGGIFSAQTVVEEAGQRDECGPLPGGELSTTIVITYNDGSILSIASSPGSFFCFDPVDGVFFVDFVGTVTGGEGRFEGAGGTWEGSARAQAARLTGETSIDLN
jgi:hypothetical protein